MYWNYSLKITHSSPIYPHNLMFYLHLGKQCCSKQTKNIHKSRDQTWEEDKQTICYFVEYNPCDLHPKKEQQTLRTGKQVTVMFLAL